MQKHIPPSLLSTSGHSANTYFLRSASAAAASFPAYLQASIQSIGLIVGEDRHVLLPGRSQGRCSPASLGHPKQPRYRKKWFAFSTSTCRLIPSRARGSGQHCARTRGFCLFGNHGTLRRCGEKSGRFSGRFVKGRRVEHLRHRLERMLETPTLRKGRSPRPSARGLSFLSSRGRAMANISCCMCLRSSRFGRRLYARGESRIAGVAVER